MSQTAQDKEVASMNVPLTLIEIDGNVRSKPNKNAIAELAASMEADGLLQPILLRPCQKREGGKTYELVAGGRRLAAAKKLKWESIDATIREISDDEFLRIQLVENVQREDLDPLDEAKAFDRLIKEGDLPVSEIATQTGKSQTFIYQRIALLNLIPKAKTMYRAGELTLGHIIQLARLTKSDQEDACDELTDENGNGMTSAGLAHWIEHAIVLDLGKAAFDVSAADVVKGVPPCPACDKQTGFEPALFPEYDAKETALCLDRKCFNAKQAAYVIGICTGLKKDGVEFVQISGAQKYQGSNVPDGVLGDNEYARSKKGECDATVRAVFVHAGWRGHEHELGKLSWVCPKKKCSVHGRAEGSTQPLTADERKSRKQAKDKTEREKLYRELLYDEVTTAADDMVLAFTPLAVNSEGVDILRIICKAVFRRMHYEDQRKMCGLLGWEGQKREHSGLDYEKPVGKKLDELERRDLGLFLFTTALVPSLEEKPYFAPDTLIEAAQLLGIDIRETRKDSDATWKETQAAKKKPKAKKAAKKKATV